MANYVDGFVFPVPKNNLGKYVKMAKEASKVWKKFGALEYYECQGDDLKPKPSPEMGTARSFIEMAGAKNTDTVWFSFVVYKSRAHRDAVNKKVMDYFGKKYADQKAMPMPFDMKKMAYGGFKAVVKGQQYDIDKTALKRQIFQLLTILIVGDMIDDGFGAQCPKPMGEYCMPLIVAADLIAKMIEATKKELADARNGKCHSWMNLQSYFAAVGAGFFTLEQVGTSEKELRELIARYKKDE